MNAPAQAISVPRILHVTFNMGIGGTEQVIRQLILATPVDQARHEIVCIDGHCGAIGEQLRSEDIPVHILQRSAGFDYRLIRNLRELIRGRKANLVHCHQYTPYLYGRLAALTTGAKVVFTEHGRFYPDRYRYKAALINPVLALSTPAIVAISNATRAALAQYEFMPKNRIQVVYNGIQPLTADAARIAELRKESGIPQDAFVYGTVSRLDPVKNQVMMLEAFAVCLQNHPSSYLLMVGDGPDRLLLEAKARDLGITDRVGFTGFIERPAQHLAAMDVFLLSSHTEGTSMTLLEAMSLGIPAVVTAVGGNVEVVEQGASGLLVPPGDSTRFAEDMMKLQADGELRGQLSAGAIRRFSDRFSATVMAGRYLQIYHQLLS